MGIKRWIAAAMMMFAMISGVNAETVSQRMAMSVAQNFFNTLYGEVTPRPKLIWNGRELTTNRLFTPFYVYNSPRGGYVAIAADSKAFPVLAYSKTRKFDRAQLGDKEKEQFEYFAREVELIRYDSRIPERAVKAWGDMPQYLTDVIHNPYATPEYRGLSEETRENLEQIDRRNNWIIMPKAVEFNIYDPERYRDYSMDDVLGEESEALDTVPFKFYEDFIRDITEEERTRAEAYERILVPTEPKVQSLGGGHYTIRLPDEAKLVRIYNITGARTHELKFKGTNTVNIDLTGQPAGYYIVLAMTKEGGIHAFKLHR